MQNNSRWTVKLQIPPKYLVPHNLHWAHVWLNGNTAYDASVTFMSNKTEWIFFHILPIIKGWKIQLIFSPFSIYKMSSVNNNVYAKIDWKAYYRLRERVYLISRTSPFPHETWLFQHLAGQLVSFLQLLWILDQMSSESERIKYARLYWWCIHITWHCM